MKKSIMLMFLGAAIACPKVQATLTFSDDLDTKALWHMDSVGTWYGFRSAPDDTSARGYPNYYRTMRVSTNSSVISTTPSFQGVANGGANAFTPYGGYTLQFDGADDYAYSDTAWVEDKSSLSLDLGFRVLGWTPVVEGAKMALISTGDWRVSIVRSGALHYIEMAVRNAAQDGFTTVTTGNNIPAAAWYDLHAEIDNGVASITFNGQTTSTSLVGGMSELDSQVIMGRNFDGDTEYYNGRIDEVRIASIPEPATLGLLGLASAILFGVRRMRM